MQHHNEKLISDELINNIPGINMYRKIFSKVKTWDILKIPLLFPIKLGSKKQKY